METNNKKNQSRAWMVVIHEQCLKNLKIDKELWQNPENYEKLANYLVLLWQKQYPARKAAVAICESAEEKFHVHMVLYSPNPVMFDAVRNMFGHSRSEILKGTKKQAVDYIKKAGIYAEKGEKVLYFLDFPEPEKTSRTDYLDEIRDLIADGLKPSEIYKLDIHHRKYEAIINKEYLQKRLDDTPLIKDLKVFWHVGLAGSGKTYEYIKLLKEYGDDGVYLNNDFSNGGLDRYVEMGCPEILFMDDLKPLSLSYGELLNRLDVYKGLQTHARYSNAVNLWTTVHITSVYSPEILYREMFPNNNAVDSYSQLKRRITAVVYHYKKDNAYRQFVLPIHAYNGIDDMKEKAALNDINYEKNKVNDDVLRGVFLSESRVNLDGFGIKLVENI